MLAKGETRGGVVDIKSNLALFFIKIVQNLFLANVISEFYAIKKNETGRNHHINYWGFWPYNSLVRNMDVR